MALSAAQRRSSGGAQSLRPPKARCRFCRDRRQRADVPVYLDGVGTTKALNTVTVRPQVDGKLISVNFKEGQDVKKGYVLAKIDPVHLSRHNSTRRWPKRRKTKRSSPTPRSTLSATNKLAATNAINKQQADTQRALVARTTRRCRPTRP